VLTDVLFSLDWAHLNLTIAALKRIFLQDVNQLHVLFELLLGGLNVIWRFLLLEHVFDVFICDLQDSLKFSRVFQFYVFCLALKEGQKFGILCNHLHFLLRGAVTMAEHCYHRS